MLNALDCDEAIKYLDDYQVWQEKVDESFNSEIFTIKEALLIAAIVSYSRAFTDSNGDNFSASIIKVNLGKIFHNDRKKIDLHKLIKDKRNKAVAHSDWKYHKTKVEEVTEFNGVVRTHSVVDYSEGIDIKLFRVIAETMSTHFRFETHKHDVSNKL